MEPELPNGIIVGYRLYYMTEKMTDVQTVKDSSKEIVYMLKNLSELPQLSRIEKLSYCKLCFRAVYKIYNMGKSFHIKTRGQLLRYNRSIDGCVWSRKISHHQLNLPRGQQALH